MHITRRQTIIGGTLLLAIAVIVVIVLPHTVGSNESSGAAVTRQIKPLPRAAIAEVQPVSPVAAVCAQNYSGKLLLVSISQQHVWACNSTVLDNQSSVTTGASAITNVDDATPTGSWHIYGKQTNLHLTGSDANGAWDDPVAYWMPFYSDYGFHDASWQTMPFGGAGYTTQGSHGCVHLPADMMAWVYNWAPIGTIVTIES